VSLEDGEPDRALDTCERLGAPILNHKPTSDKIRLTFERQPTLSSNVWKF